MSAVAPLATRAFTHHDQEQFAALSGDYNPMHMDMQAARRTPAGACVVHGVQSFLWALETLSSVLGTQAPAHRLRGLDADFAQFLYVGETASLYLVRLTDTDARVELRVGETRISQYVLHFGEPHLPPTEPAASPGAAIHYAASRIDPLPLEWNEVAAAHGTIETFKTDDAAASVYPVLSAAIGATRISAILALTRLVGMVSPGLHSTFHRIGVKFAAEPEATGGLAFSTTRSDPRFSVATITVRAPGVFGTVKASRRTPPTLQPSSLVLRDQYPMPNFSGHTALVVGGSRGLGEVTAKLLGLAGVHVIVSYASGAGEASAVAEDIVAAGGSAAVLKLDVLAPLAEQLAALAHVPGSVYYFATQRISGRALPGFSTELFQRFCGVYVTAFHDLCLRLAEPTARPLHAFYPSSVFVTETTKGMAEYAMAKAAGEALAADLTRFNPSLFIDTVRLPRVATDQTAGMIEVEMGSAAACMAPIVRRLEGRVAGEAG